MSNLDVWSLCSLVFKTGSFTHSEHIEETSIKSKCDHLILNSDFLCPSFQRASSCFLKQITTKTISYSVILSVSQPRFVIIAMSVKLFKILHAPYIILSEMHERKKILSVMKKASGTSDVSSRREIALPINSSLLELTSEVPEPFSISLKTSLMRFQQHSAFHSLQEMFSHSYCRQPDILLTV